MKKILSMFLVSTLSVGTLTSVISCSSPKGENYNFLLKGEPKPAYDSQTKTLIQENVAREIADNIWKKTKSYRESLGWPSAITETSFVASKMISVTIDDSQNSMYQYKTGTNITLKVVFKSNNYPRSNYYKGLIKQFWTISNKDREVNFDTDYYLDTKVASFSDLRTSISNGRTPSKNWMYDYNFNNVKLGNINGADAYKAKIPEVFSDLIGDIQNRFTKNVKSYDGKSMSAEDVIDFNKKIMFNNTRASFGESTTQNFSAIYYNGNFNYRYYDNKQDITSDPNLKFISGSDSYSTWLRNTLLTTDIKNTSPTYNLNIFAHLASKKYNNNSNVQNGNYIDQHFSITSPLYFAPVKNIFEVISGENLNLHIKGFDTSKTQQHDAIEAWQKTAMYNHLTKNYNFTIDFNNISITKDPKVDKVYDVKATLKCTWPNKVSKETKDAKVVFKITSS